MLPTIVAQIGDHISNQGIYGSQNDNGTGDNIYEDVRNVNISNGQSRCSYKEFVACKPKEFDDKGGAIAYTCWVEKMEAVHDISGYRVNQKVKYVVGSLIAIKPPTIQNTILKARVLTEEVVRNGSLKKSSVKRGYGRELSKEGNFKGDNKRKRAGKVFATITNPVKKEAGPKMFTPLNARNLIAARGACYECGCTDHYKSACPRLNRAPRQGENHLKQALTIEGGQGRGNNGNIAHVRAFVIGAEKARQDPNIVTEEKVKHLMRAKTKEQKLKDIVVVRNFS
ncbi:hypothetical protein Tco_1269528 [Tanacetum coccineum]